MKPRCHCLTVEQRGGRTIFLVERIRSAERVRVYFRLGRWRYFASDAPVRDQALVGAVRRFIRIRGGDERRAASELRPPRTIIAVPHTTKSLA